THASETFGTFRRRIPDARSIDASKGRWEEKVAADGVRAIRFGAHEIDLSAVSQIVDPAQTAAIAHGILRAKRLMDGKISLQEAVEAVVAGTESRGLDALAPYPSGGLAAFRPIELAAAINRLRTLRVWQTE
ncbi:MAG TPA: ATPase, partial [Methanofollis liminatans]|nr:ATPase [Methanofollis liminatans]